MKEKLKNWMNQSASYLELIISIVILLAILIASISVIAELGIFNGQWLNISSFETFLSHALALVIGIEFIKMLIKHTPGSVIEVLLFAVARQLIVYHTTMLELLLGIAAVAGLFAIRKYLFMDNID